MKVTVLQQFLQSLIPALKAAGDPAQSANELERACRGMDSFREMTLPDFFAFLQKADEYRRNGQVQTPSAFDLEMQTVSAALTRIESETDANRLREAQEAIGKSLASVAEKAGLKSTLKPVPGWTEGRQLRARIAPQIRTILELAARITDPNRFGDQPVREGIAAIEKALDRDQLKALGAEFGIKVTPAAKPEKALTDILTKLSGHKPSRSKSVKPKSIDPAVVSSHIQRLKELMERSNDPDLLPEREIDAAIAQFQSLSKPALFEVVTQAGIEGVFKSTSSDEMLNRIRNRLNVVRRARERAEV